MGVQGSTLYIFFRFGVLLTKLDLHLSDYFGQEKLHYDFNPFKHVVLHKFMALNY